MISLVRPAVMPTTTGFSDDFFWDLLEAAMAVMAVVAVMTVMAMVAPVAAVAAMAALAALATWQRRHSRGIYDAIVCASVDDVAVEEVLDKVPVRYYLLSPEAIVHEVVANVPHPCDEVGAGISARRFPCVKTLVTAKP